MTGVTDHRIEDGKLLVLYDGDCGLCHGFVRFLARRDRQDKLRFQSLQSERAGEILASHGRDPQVIDTVVVAERGKKGLRLRLRSDAAIRAMTALGRAWRLMWLLRIFPWFLRDWVYRGVAKVRKRVWGGAEACELPSPENAHKFL